MFIAANSNYPTITLNDYTSFINRSKIIDKNVNLAAVDRMFIATNTSNNRYKNSAERELHRYEFVEVIVRLSLVKYKEPKIIDNLHDLCCRGTKDYREALANVQDYNMTKILSRKCSIPDPSGDVRQSRCDFNVMYAV